MSDPVPIFTGHVDAEGRAFIDGLAGYRRWMQTLRGQRVEYTVRRLRSTRSLDQNGYLHAVPFPMLATHFGCSVSDIKLALMGECWGWKYDPVSRREIPVRPSTSAMDVEECAFFIDWLLPWALTEHGVDIPPPTDKTTERTPR